MAVANLVTVPTTSQELAVWAFANQAHHRDINSYIRRTRGILLPEYVLDPVDTRLDSVWSAVHQAQHNSNDAILGVEPFDISEPDWQNPDQMTSWIWLHWRLHYAEAEASGVW